MTFPPEAIDEIFQMHGELMNWSVWSMQRVPRQTRRVTGRERRQL